MKLVLVPVVVLGLAASLFACTSSPGPSPTPTPTPTPPANTFGTLATAGQTLYATACASCHGNNGQGGIGPPLWGTGAHLSGYKTGQGLLDYVTKTMPPGSPGSLSHQDYLNLLGYLLVQNNDASATTTFNESQLGAVTLK